MCVCKMRSLQRSFCECGIVPVILMEFEPSEEAPRFESPQWFEASVPTPPPLVQQAKALVRVYFFPQHRKQQNTGSETSRARAESRANALRTWEVT